MVGVGTLELSEHVSVKEMTISMACKCQVRVDSSVQFI